MPRPQARMDASWSPADAHGSGDTARGRRPRVQMQKGSTSYLLMLVPVARHRDLHASSRLLRAWLSLSQRMPRPQARMDASWSPADAYGSGDTARDRRPRVQVHKDSVELRHGG